MIFLGVSCLTFAQGPTSQFTATPLAICAGEIITFTNSSTAGSTPIIQWVKIILRCWA